jgi:hypothetical protein
MSRVIVSLCLLGAGLATANVLLLQQSGCPALGKQTALSSVVDGARAQSKSSTPQDKPDTQKSADLAPKASATSQDITGSLAKNEKPVPAVAGKGEIDPKKNPGESAQWAVVSVNSTVYSAPSSSSRFVAYQPVGTPLRVIKRSGGWAQVVDPVDSQVGWIYGKHLRLSDAPPPHVGPKPSAQPRKRGWRGYSSRKPHFTVRFGVYPIW